MKMNATRTLATVALCMALVPIAGAQADAGKGKILAKINGVPIYQLEVYNPADYKDTPEGKAKQSQQLLLDWAIDQELLYQEAQKAGLDQDPAYVQSVKRQASDVTLRKLQVLGNFLVQNDDSLKKAADVKAITDKEIEQFYEDNKEKHFENWSKKQAIRMIPRQLAQNKRQTAYLEWLKELVTTVPVSINGKDIPDEMLQQAFDAKHLRTPGKPLATHADARIDRLWQIVMDAIVKGGTEATTFEVGNTVLKWSEFYQLEEKLQAVVEDAPGARPAAAAEVLHSLEIWILADEARKQGLDQDPKFTEYINRLKQADSRLKADAGGDRARKQARQVLGRNFIRRQGFDSKEKMDQYQVEQSAIEAFYQKNPARFQQIEERRGKAKVFEVIEGILKSEQVKQAQADFVKGLRQGADIEIVN